jgi:uracil-DNA glycosylase
LSKNHGRVYQYNGYPVISTFAPQAVLMDQELKKAVWYDLNILKKFLENSNK